MKDSVVSIFEGCTEANQTLANISQAKESNVRFRLSNKDALISSNLRK